MAGETITEYLERNRIHIGHLPVVLTLDGVRIDVADWGLIKPYPGQIIHIRATVQRGDGGSDPLKTVLTLAVLVGAPHLARMMPMEGAELFTIAGETITMGSVYQSVIGMAGMMLVNSLVPPPQPHLPQFNQDNPSPTYSLSGGANRARPFEPMPLLLGTHRIFPDLGAREYTEFEGEDQYLMQVFNFGLSDLNLSDFRIGNTPLTEYNDIISETSGADGALDLFPGNVDTISGGSLENPDGGTHWVTRTGSINATALAVDLTLTLYRAGDRGIESHSVTIAIEYRLVGAPSWTATPGEVILSNDTRKPLRKTWYWQVSSGQYEVRCRKLSTDESDERNTAIVNWSVLRTYQPDSADYSGQLRYAMKIRASGQLNGRVDRLSALGRSKCEVWNGSTWVADQVTSNPAWLFRWFANGKCEGGGDPGSGAPIFGANLPDSRLDLDALKEWGVWCDTHGYSVNVIIDTRQSCSEVLNIIARCGRAAPTWTTGKLGAVWDEADKPVTAIYGMPNIVAGSFTVEYATEKLADEVVARFINPDLDWQQDTVRVSVPGVSTAYRPITVDLVGVTDKTQAGKEANLLAAAQYYRRRRYVWETDMEGLVSSRGDVVILSHDLTQWGQSGRLISGTTTVLELDRAVEFTPATQHYITVREPDGDWATYPVQIETGSTDTVTLTTALPVAPDTGTPIDWLYCFDPLATPGKKVKIVSMEPVNENRVRISAVDEDAGYYATENGSFTHVVASTTNSTPKVSDVTVTEELIQVGSGFAVILTLSWQTTGNYREAVVRAGVNGAPLTERGVVNSNRFEFQVPPTGTVIYEVIPGNPLVQAGDPYTGTHTISGIDLDPDDVIHFTINGDEVDITPVTNVDLAGYRLRYHPGQNDSWGDAAPLHEGLIVGFPYTLLNKPAGQATLLLKAVDTSGNESRNPAVIYINLGDAVVANVLETFDFHAGGFSGTITNGSVVGGDLVADDASLLMWNPDDSAAMWGDSADLMWSTVTYKQMTYLGTFTPSAAADGYNMVLDHTISAETYTVEYRVWGKLMWGDSGDLMWSGDDTALMWADEPWRIFTGSVEAKAGLEYELRVVTGFGETQGSISKLAVKIDVPDISEILNDVSIAAAGTALPITQSYNTIKNVNITIQEDAGGAVSVKLINKDTTGPTIKLFDASGTATTGTVDARIQGY